MLFQGHKQTHVRLQICLKEVGNNIEMSMPQNEFHAAHFVQKCECAMCHVRLGNITSGQSPCGNFRVR